MKNWSDIIFSGAFSFKETVEQVFEYQFENNTVYRRYCEALGINPEKASYHPEPRKSRDRLITGSEGIPLLPIKAFKDVEVVTAEDKSTFNIQPSSLTFKSSGTSDMQRGAHHVVDASIYDRSILEGFRHFYNLDNVVIWGYTPGYSENPHSSLIYMIQKLIDQDDSGLSRFLPLNKPLNPKAVDEVHRQKKQLILFGAAFGLLDLLELQKVELPSNSIVIETGGMKTHRREVNKKELHKKLAKGFGLDSSRVHSEYGMAELLSQAYTTGGSWFKTVPWMQVSIRNPDNPFEEQSPYEEGLIGVIDLANVHSCSFLLTGDKGLMDNNGRFQVLGRWNPKDLRGCNFLIDED